jgi:AraC family transcriptional regulator
MLAPRLQRVMTFIDDNITLDLSVSTLAQVAGMSSFYFCRSFKQSTGITPHQFVLARRMELARQLLLQEPMRLMQVARKVGFTDQSQFTRVFRKIVGTTPSQFRRTAGGAS